jgi:polyribonucleotide nucleotidyltransferase
MKKSNTIRIVSDILESMVHHRWQQSVRIVSLMDAGVPVTAAVSGIAWDDIDANR